MDKQLTLVVSILNGRFFHWIATVQEVPSKSFRKNFFRRFLVRCPRDKRRDEAMLHELNKGTTEWDRV